MDAHESVKSIIWLGETWGFWIQTAVFTLSAFAGVAVIYFNGKQARTRALIDMLMQHKADQELVRATHQVHQLQISGKSLAQHVNENTEQRQAILKVLNTHEFIAVGVRMGAFDEKVYKQMQCSNVLRLWSSSCGFILELRKTDRKETLFQDFERLARRWEKKPIQKIPQR